MSQSNLVLSVQVLQEFYVQATRPTRDSSLSHPRATALVQYWLRHRVVPLTVQILQDALDLKDRFQISYWDPDAETVVDDAEARTMLDRERRNGYDLPVVS